MIAYVMGQQLLGILLSLTAAVSWGGADFSGGYASRRLKPFQVLFLSALSSLFLLLILALFARENLPSPRTAIYALLAGITGTVGLTALYWGLSIGSAAVVAPVSGVVGAAIPLLVGAVVQGLPGYAQITGFILALIGIWWVSKSGDHEAGQAKQSLIIGVIAGLGFGGFLAFIAQAGGEGVFFPLAIARIAAVLITLLYLLRRKQSIPKLSSSPVAILAGLLDTIGNVFYIYGTRFTRLDTAAVLSSLYPAVTVLLANLIMKERVSAAQWIGVVVCITAIVLITL